MEDKVVKEFTSALSQADLDLVNGAIAGILLLNAYKDPFGFEGKELEKVIDQSWMHKVTFLSLVDAIRDEKFLKKKAGKLISKYVSDGWTDVRKAACYAEPLLLRVESEKKQRKWLEKQTKDLAKLDMAAAEGLALGVGVVTAHLSSGVHELVLTLYRKLVEDQNAESVLAMAAYGVGIAGAGMGRPVEAAEVLKGLAEASHKKVRQTASLCLAFLTPILPQAEKVEVAKLLIQLTGRQATYPRNLAVIAGILSSPDPQNFVEEVKSQPGGDLELSEIFAAWDKNGENTLEFFAQMLETEHSQLKLAVLYSTYVAESSRHKLQNKGEALKKMADLTADLSRGTMQAMRAVALYRLLSFSLSLKTKDYMPAIQGLLRDTLKQNRMLAALATAFIAGRADPSSLDAARRELFLTNDPQVRKGTMVGMGMAANPKIVESDTADEYLLGLLELLGQSPEIGFILLMIGYY